MKSMRFGSLLNPKYRTLHTILCLWLLERYTTIRRILEICGKRIPMSLVDVELVMRLSTSGKDVASSHFGDVVADLCPTYNASNKGISVHLLKEKLGEQEASYSIF